MNLTNTYLAYGALVRCKLDLGAYLLPGTSGLHEVSLHESEGASSEKELDVVTPLFTSHGRDILLRSDRSFGPPEMGQPWCFEVEGVVAFCWRGGSADIRYQRFENCTDELLAFWLIHIFLPLYFTLEGTYEFIHACSVVAEEDTILFIAPSHGGKSTLTDHFLQQGHMLVSDDKVATYFDEGRYFAVPSHPNHRPYRRFEDLGYRVQDFNPVARPVDAIYQLRGTEAAAEVTIEEITGHQKFAGMLPNYLFNFSYLREKRLRYLGQLVSSVPVFRVEVPWDLERLGEVHDTICKHRLET